MSEREPSDSSPEAANAEGGTESPTNAEQGTPTPKGGKRGGSGSAQGRPKPPLLIGIIAGAILIGGAGGSQIIAPKLRGPAGPLSEEVSPGAADAGSHGKSKKKGKGAHGEGGPVFRIESIIVNPAETEGTRFLMATIAFEFSDPKAEERMRASEVRVRDIVVTVLETQTLEALTQPGARDRVKRQLADAVKEIARDDHLAVYLPQFVIQ